MKSSRYNIVYHHESYSYFFNSLSKAFFRCTRNLGIKIENILNSDILVELLSGNEQLNQQLCNGGFVIPSSLNEIELIRELYYNAINKKHYKLVILPTLNCNFSCYYCVQNHIPSKMSEDVMALVMAHIKYMIEVEHIQSLNIEWFGGEPFMYFNEVIRQISQYAIDLCINAGIAFYNSATTNASLISEHVAKELSKLKFESFQITLDGDKELHNAIKFAPNIQSAFDTTLRNIVSILSENTAIKVVLRINYTTATLKSDIVNQVCSIIPKDVRHRITVTLKKVWQEAVVESRFEDYLRVLDDFKVNGFNIVRMDIVRDFMPCYVNKKYYDCINFNGGVLKCTNCDMLYSVNPPGKIIPGHGIEWSDDFDIKNQQPSFENERCLKCKILPMCMGHCPKNFIDGDISICKLAGVDFNLKKAVIAYIDDYYTS